MLIVCKLNYYNKLFSRFIDIYYTTIIWHKPYMFFARETNLFVDVAHWHYTWNFIHRSKQKTSTLKLGETLLFLLPISLSERVKSISRMAR